MAYREHDLRRVPEFGTITDDIEQTFRSFMESVRVGARGAATIDAKALIAQAQRFLEESERQDEMVRKIVAKLGGAS